MLYSDSSPLGVWQYKTPAADWEELAFPAAAWPVVEEIRLEKTFRGPVPVMQVSWGCLVESRL